MSIMGWKKQNEFLASKFLNWEIQCSAGEVHLCFIASCSLIFVGPERDGENNVCR